MIYDSFKIRETKSEKEKRKIEYSAKIEIKNVSNW